ncbi:acyl-CoA dehydrogenase, middle domain protein [Mycobacterium kansasii 662]|uniref:Acyl-CoA dehydrogenase, middle domain protein n=1 Tax=Mycobacterium kansasii 662 TaxID=1299326 RepID=X7XY53_MYCKA|nr:acyl-CoA dehydrogenase, middle domain protein [Mycobacterium kansasii 662]
MVAKLLTLFGHRRTEDGVSAGDGHRELRATMALTEPGGGSDLQSMSTTALVSEAGGLRINGAKTWITNARRLRADRVAVARPIRCPTRA